MKLLSIIWTILQNLIVVFIAFLLTSSYAYSDNLAVIALLIIIYASLNIALTLQTRMQTGFAIQSQAQNAIIIKKLGDSSTADYLEQEVSEANEAMKKTNKKFYINMTGSFLLWVIALFSLLGSL